MKKMKLIIKKEIELLKKEIEKLSMNGKQIKIKFQ